MLFGIDVSYFQSVKCSPVGTVKLNWGEIFTHGFRFFYARACDGTNADSSLDEHWGNGIANGFVGGCYAFGHPSHDAVQLATFFFNLIKDKLVVGNLRPVIDMESLNADKTVPANAGAWTLTFCTTFEYLSRQLLGFSVKLIVYASTSYMQTMLQQSSALKAYIVLDEDFWDAEYHTDGDPTHSPTRLPFVAWQYKGNAVEPGFSFTLADLDVTFNTTLDKLTIKSP